MAHCCWSEEVAAGDFPQMRSAQACLASSSFASSRFSLAAFCSSVSFLRVKGSLVDAVWDSRATQNLSEFS
eukprot:2840079-Rhodomonas_salina.1